MKRAEKGSCVVIWDRNDYLLEADKQPKDKKVYLDVKYNANNLKDLAEASNEIFSCHKRRGFITEKKKLNILQMSRKKLLILANFTFNLKFIRDFLMYQVYQ